MAATSHNQSFWDAVSENNIPRVSWMLRNWHGINIDFPGPISSFSPLIEAMSNGNLELMRLLVDNGASCEFKCPHVLHLDQTPLFWAAKCQHACAIEMMQLLIDKGASATAVDAKGSTIFHRLFLCYGSAPVNTEAKLWLLLDSITDVELPLILAQTDWNGNTASMLLRKTQAARLATEILDHEIERRRQRLELFHAFRNAVMPDSQALVSELGADLVAIIAQMHLDSRDDRR